MKKKKNIFILLSVVIIACIVIGLVCFIKPYEKKDKYSKIGGAIKVTIMDTESQLLSGVKIVLKNLNGQELKVLESDENGVVLFENLMAGKYIIQQDEEIDKYIVMDIPVQVEVSDNSVKEVTLKNSLVEGKLKITSVGEDKVTPLAGITYEILDENKNVIETLVSNENGEIISKELKNGTYYFREIDSPEEIHIDSTERTFIISDNGVEEYIVMHYYAKGKIQFGCSDVNGAPVQGVVYEIYDALGKLVDTQTTDENGRALSNYLLLGEYFYKCISVPEDFVVDDIKYDFKLSKKMQILECWIEIESK